MIFFYTQTNDQTALCTASWKKASMYCSYNFPDYAENNATK